MYFVVSWDEYLEMLAGHLNMKQSRFVQELAEVFFEMLMHS
jgi:hypothetical protein